MKNLLKTYHNVHEWSVDDVKQWLLERDFDDNICDLFVDHKIDGKALLTLREDDLRKHPLQLSCLGEIKKIYLSISQLQTINHNFYSQTSSNTLFDLNSINYLQLKEQLKIELCDSNRVFNQYQQVTNRKKQIINHHLRANIDDRATSISSFAEELSEMDDDRYLHHLKMKNGRSRDFKPEIWKGIVAMLYFIAVTWITAIVMVIVHDRVPDMTKYPPLPDIFLDNVPMMPFAFVMCELCGLILFLMSTLLLVFHKHRFILIRRMFSLFGSVFLLRCVTMLITSLSVPGRHLNCNPRPYGDWFDKLRQAFIIWQGGGMSIQGVRTCGDYMFSGHTVTLTLLNFFLTEYTPRSLYFVHTLSWVLNLFGVFFILAGHEHYSIDVFIAFYISTRLFLYYHTLANNYWPIISGDRRRTRIWFPLFYFFESGVNGIVPNEFELPFNKRFRNLIQKLRKLVLFRNSQKTNSHLSSKASNMRHSKNDQSNNNSNSTLDHSRSSKGSSSTKEHNHKSSPSPNNKNSIKRNSNNHHSSLPQSMNHEMTNANRDSKRKNKKNK